VLSEKVLGEDFTIAAVVLYLHLNEKKTIITERDMRRVIAALHPVEDAVFPGALSRERGWGPLWDELGELKVSLSDPYAVELGEVEKKVVVAKVEQAFARNRIAAEKLLDQLSLTKQGIDSMPLDKQPLKDVKRNAPRDSLKKPSGGIVIKDSYL
jgi:hypothetical protein